jgi:hypothetical protein
LSEQFQNRIDKQVFSVYYYHPSELRLCAPNLPSLCKYNYHTPFLQRFIDCRINMNEPPILATDLSNDSLCDTGARACNFISAFGENIYASNNTKCRVETAQVKRFYRYKIN